VTQDPDGRTSSTDLARLAWPHVPDAGTLLVVPVGSLEQHGPHLPLSTDTQVATAVAVGLLARLDEAWPAVRAPAVAYGASGEHEAFPGTVSIGQEALRAVLVEIGRSARRWAARLLLLNGHGGNAMPTAAAVERLRYEGDDAAWLPCAPPKGDAHAGRTETSLLLAIAPEQVALADAVPGETRPVDHLLPELRRSGVRAVSPNGVLGDPAGASAREGVTLLDAMIDVACAAVRSWTVLPDGRLSKDAQ